MTRLILLAGLALVLVGCGAKTPREQMFKELRAQRDVATPYPAANITYASFDAGHGYRVEYLDTEGRVYLWYPGNRKPVIGAWNRVLDDVCYRYGKNNFNPQTLRNGGAWNCEPSERHGFNVVAYQSGDVFGLTTGRIPYIRDRCDLPEGLRPVKKVSCK